MLGYVSSNNIFICKKLKAFFFLHFLILLSLPLVADDLKLSNGNTVSGTITGASDGVVKITTLSTGGSATLSFNFNQISSVTMAPPADFTKAQSADPATRITLLAPLVATYQGLPSDWVIDAMASLADAYDAQNAPDKSLALYNQINQLYPNSRYQIAAQAGKAKIALKAGQIDQAQAALKPLLDQANQNLAPSPAEGRLYAQAFYIQGQVLEAQKKLPEALEAYLTVKTMFYQNPELASQADAAANKLRSQNSNLSVN